MTDRERIKEYIDYFKVYGEGRKKKDGITFTGTKITDEAFIKQCLETAYHSAKRNCDGINADTLDEAFDQIKDKIHDGFFPTCADFNELHKECCNIFFKTVTDKNKKPYAYGIAQKVINLTFKYLYCHDEAKNYEDNFKDCHTVLDSYILKYYSIKDTSWTKLSEKDYDDIEETIKNQRKRIDGLTQFQEEFVVWPQLVMSERLERLIKLIEEDGEDVKMMLKSELQIEEIKRLYENHKETLSSIFN